MIVGVKPTVRLNTGTKTLVVVYNNRWSEQDKAIINSIEIVQNNNPGLFYCTPIFSMPARSL